MKNYQQAFIQMALEYDALKFGQFTLKSGRLSPYFFNVGAFNSGRALAKLGQFYAACIQDANINIDTLFGPAYKGIPLVATTAIALAEHYQRDIAYCFNRKEAKDHGEGGHLIGHALTGQVLIIDDVITAGTAIRESIQIIKQSAAQFAGVVVMFDRQEQGQQPLSAIQEIEQTYQVPVYSIINLDSLLDFLRAEQFDQKMLAEIQQYRQQYGVE